MERPAPLLESLAAEEEAALDGALVLRAPEPGGAQLQDQRPGVSSRSNPATYTGILDDVRKAFAAANKVSPSLFSFNSKGACENCQGLGVIYTELTYLDEVMTPCEVCGGKRFKDEVLTYKFNDKSISDVLAMSVQEALAFFKLPEITRRLQAISDVGLDYLTPGQPLSTLLGGEYQRIKLASELHKRGSVYVLDEPTTGMHMSDIGHLLAIINRLVDGGNAVIVIEHNLDSSATPTGLLIWAWRAATRAGGCCLRARPGNCSG